MHESLSHFFIAAYAAVLHLLLDESLSRLVSKLDGG